MRDSSVYYDFGSVLSRNGAWNFITGGRGIGKTYGAKKMVVRKALDKKRKFIYLRRYKEELAIAANTFFADIVHEFPGYQFRKQGNEAQVTQDPDGSKQTWVTIGYFLALSTMQNYKSVAFPDVDTIIFDEYIVEKGRRYLPSEVNTMLNFFNTVDRGNDRVRVLFLANAVSIMNPYFIEYDIEPDGREFMRIADGFIICHFPELDDFNNAMRDTRFGRFIANTEYASYAIENQFADNHDKLVKRKSSNAMPMYNIDTGSGVFSLWMDSTTGEFYAQERLPRDVKTYTTDVSRVTETVTYIPGRDPKIEYPRLAFRNGRMLFDKPATRNVFLKVFK